MRPSQCALCHFNKGVFTEPSELSIPPSPRSVPATHSLLVLIRRNININFNLSIDIRYKVLKIK